MFGDAMSIFARSTCAPSGNSPARIRANRSRFSSTVRERYGLSLPGSVSVPRYCADLVGRQAVDVRLPVLDQDARRTRTAARSSRRRSSSRSSQSNPSQRTSSLIASTYSTSSLVGLVSSKRRLQVPPNSCARRRSSGRSTWRGRCAGSRSARGETGWPLGRPVCRP